METQYPYQTEAELVRSTLMLERESKEALEGIPENSPVFQSLALVLEDDEILLGRARASRKAPSSTYVQLFTSTHGISVKLEDSKSPTVDVAPVTYERLLITPEWPEDGDLPSVKNYQVQIVARIAGTSSSFSFTYDVDAFNDADSDEMTRRVSRLKALL